MACEMRRVGDAVFRVFKSRADAARAFSISGSQVANLISNSTKCSPDVLGKFEARDCAPPADAYGTFACEVRQVGDKWRRFASRKDAAAAFPGLWRCDIGTLINNPSKSCYRGKYEARNVGDKSSDSDDAEADDDAAPARKRPRLGLGVRRVGSLEDSRPETTPCRVSRTSRPSGISELVSRPSKARLAIGKFEARRVGQADGEEDSKAEEESPAVRGAALVGRKVRIWWPHDKEWFTGTVGAFDGRLHEVTYDDGSLWDEDLETPGERKWELVGGGDDDVDADAASDASSPRKRARPDEEPCCAICLEPLDADAPSLEACGHRLHADCLFGAGQLVSHAWADNAPSTRRGQRVECPTCRQASWVPQEDIEGYRVRECKDT